MAGSYTLDGIPMQDAGGRWWLDVNTGVRAMPAARIGAYSAPGQDGERTNLNSTLEQGKLGLSFVVKGADHAAMMANYELLTGILSQRGRLLPLVHDYGNGQTRVAMIQLSATSDPDMINASTLRFKVIASIPDGVWRDAALAADFSAPLTTTTTTQTVTPLAGTTGPIDDALIRIKGAISTATVTDPVTGDQISFNAALLATEYVIIDCANWTARKVTSNTWTGGTNVDSSFSSTRGSGPALALYPEYSTGAARVQIKVVSTNPATSPTCEVRAKRSFI
jgi:hypothetical protein